MKIDILLKKLCFDYNKFILNYNYEKTFYNENFYRLYNFENSTTTSFSKMVLKFGGGDGGMWC